MPHFGKFEVSVVVDGKALPEYGITTSEATKSVACWIPSQEGKVGVNFLCPVQAGSEVYNNVQAFSVMLENKSYPKALKISVMVDGERINSMVLHPEAVTRHRFSDIITSSTTYRDLLFSRIELTDDDDFLNANVKDLGEISLCVYTGTIGGARSDFTTYKIPEKKVHERSKKALGHQVKFGKEKFMAPQNFVNFTVTELIATFVFKYRSIDILRADGIAPPDPAVNKRKANGATDDEIEDEDGDEDQDEDDERELKALLEQVNKIQSKLAKKLSKKAGPKKKMKREPRPLLISGEVIDLT
ncbi:hypothetical protein BDZ94DRAFT_578440 [Collybia nuda]|uniref:DUF7918 domain-containing protein n=1 Tax=Collybia nuda TaxID=64659 RepID=A0A9P6CFG3_9AGAR|nr:hypothetical protein BDZ94DRAFT_578440 [Collybia nuda]